MHPRMGGRPGVRSLRTWEMQPLWAATLKAHTPEGVDVALVDDRLEAIDFDAPADVVGINAETYTARRGYEVAEGFRRRGVPVVIGGFHASLVPEEAMQHADAVVIGEGEPVWGRLLADASAGRLRSRYEAERPMDLADLKTDRSIFAGKRYLPLELVETGRGCPHSCEFCSVTRFFRGRYRPRPVAGVVAELQSISSRRVFFVDDNIIGRGAAASRELFSALVPLRLKWVSQASLDTARDEELLGLMCASGCSCLLVGIESLDPANLRLMGKSVNSAFSDYDAAITTMRRKRIPLYCTMLVGYDFDDTETPERLFAFAEKHKVFMAAFNHVTAFPGTPLYDRLRSEGRLRHDRWWMSEGYRYGSLPHEPRGASAAALEASCQAMRERFYGPASITRRLFDATNGGSLMRAAAFLAANASVMRDVRRRNGFHLGKGEAG